MALTNVDDFAAYLRRDLDPFETYTAQTLLDAAESLVVEYCGWHIGPEEQDTLTVDGSGLCILALPTMKLVDVVSVTERGATLDPTTYTWSVHGVLQRRSGNWTGERRGVVVEIIHGYTPVPAWVQTLIYAMAGRAFLGNLGITQEASGGESVTYAQPAPGLGGTVTLLPQETAMLSRLAVEAAA